jgi:integrase
MFFLDRPSSPTPTFIFVRLRCNDGWLKYPMKKKVLPTNWNSTSLRVIKDTEKINAVLDRIATLIRNLLLQRDLNGVVITKSLVEKSLDKALGRNAATQNFFPVIDTIIDDREAGRELTRQGKRFSPETIRGYRHSRGNLKKFDSNMTFEGITINTYADLIAFFNTKDHSLNSLGKIVKNWKVFLKAAHKRGAHENLIYLHEDFRVPGEDTDDVYLNEKELKAIYEHNLPNKTLDLVRDWFIIDCFTGLRISDIRLLGKQNILKDTIQIANEKTDTKVVIPKHPYVKAILKKWNGLPVKVTDQEMNRSIKEVCELAGIKDPVLYSVTKGGQRKDFHFKKYEMVSNHSCRRSFITNLLNAGIPDNQVMQLAGIKKHSTLMRYKKTKPEETAKLLAGHSFFK